MSRKIAAFFACTLLMVSLAEGTDFSTDIALRKPAQQSSVYQGDARWDASKGVDGIKTGNLWDGGFHTTDEQNPWWQVDLQGFYSINEIRLFNRLDCCSERARSLQVLVSSDGKRWSPLYSNNGNIFGGADGKFLRVAANGAEARFVRVQLREKNCLHLDEVEVYGTARENYNPETAGREYTSRTDGREYTAKPDYNQSTAQPQQEIEKPRQQRTQPQTPSPEQDKLRDIFNKVNEFLHK